MHEKSPVVIPVQRAVSDALGIALHREFKLGNGVPRVTVSSGSPPRVKRQIEEATAPLSVPFSDSAFTADKILSTRLSFTVAPDAYQPGAMCDALKKKYGTLHTDDQQSITSEAAESDRTASGRQNSGRKRNKSDENPNLSLPLSFSNENQVAAPISKPTDVLTETSEQGSDSRAAAEESGQKPDSSPMSGNCATPPPRKFALDAFSTPSPRTPIKLLRSPTKSPTTDGFFKDLPDPSQSSSISTPSKSPVIGPVCATSNRQATNKERVRSNSGNRPTTPTSPTKPAGLPLPRVDFFPAARLDDHWPTEHKVPRAGLTNGYSNCYANSAIQCLFNCPPFVNFLLQNHGKNGPCSAGCALCWMNNIASAFGKNNAAFYSSSLINFIREQPSLRLYHHEDAQEFILLLLERMHLDYIRSFRAQNQRSNNGVQIPKHIDCFTEYTTPINRIFSGFYCQRIQCMQCKTVHEPTYQPFRDIQLDVGGDGFDIKAGLKRFSCVEEMTDSNNLYDCEICKKKCRARKVLQIYRAPPVLMFQFKRFRRNRFILASKIGAPASVPLELDLRPYMSSDWKDADDAQASSTLYQLSGAVIHHGSSLAGGHYTAVCRSGNNGWHEYDDSYVSQIRSMAHLNNILSRAYVVFYRRVSNSAATTKAGSAASQPSSSSQERTPKKSSVIINGARKNAVSPPLSMAPKEPNVLTRLMAAYGSGDNDDDDSAPTTPPKLPIDANNQPPPVAAAAPPPALVLRKPITFDRSNDQQQRLPRVATPPRDAADDRILLSPTKTADKLEAHQQRVRPVSATQFYGGIPDNTVNSPNKRTLSGGSVIIASNSNSTVRYNKQVQQDPFSNYNEQHPHQTGNNAADNRNNVAVGSNSSTTQRQFNNNYTLHAAASSSANTNNARRPMRPSFVPRQVHNGYGRSAGGGRGGGRRGNHHHHPYSSTQWRGFVIDGKKIN